MTRDRTLTAVLDMDPGHDDALALLTALGTLDVLGVTTVAGNQTLEKTTLNARRILSAAGSQLPVAAGYDRPWFAPLATAGEVHGASGLDGWDFDPIPPYEDPGHAMAFLETVFDGSRGPVDWIATGPLTNVAAFLAGHPHCRPAIASLTIMGGSLGAGNITSDAEFNIYVDPEAAQWVFDSGMAIRLAGLDVTHKALLRFDELPRFYELGHPLGEMLVAMFSFYGRREAARGAVGFPIHDVLAVAALVRPDLFEWRTMSIGVGPHGRENRGATRPREHGPAIEVALDIDVSAFFKWMWEALDRLSHR